MVRQLYTIGEMKTALSLDFALPEAKRAYVVLLFHAFPIPPPPHISMLIRTVWQVINPGMEPGNERKRNQVTSEMLDIWGRA